MANKFEGDRREIKESGSPLVGHSLNQKILRRQQEGVVKFMGKDVLSVAATHRRDCLRRERQQALYDSITRVFDGRATEEDILIVSLLSDEFEQVDAEAPNATIINFSGMETSDEHFGEPEFFRKS